METLEDLHGGLLRGPWPWRPTSHMDMVPAVRGRRTAAGSVVPAEEGADLSQELRCDLRAG